MAKAKKLPSGRWRVRVLLPRTSNTDNKQHFKSFTANTKSEAERMANQWKYSQKEEPSNITVSKAVDEYITSKAAVLSPSTVREYRRIRKIYIDGTSMENIKLSSVNNLQLQKWVSELSERIGAKTIRNAYGLVSAMMQQQVPDKTFRVTMPYREMPRLNTPTEKEIQDMIGMAGEKLQTAIILSVCGNGALRRGEVCAIKQKDINRDDCTVFIHSDFVRDEKGVWIYKPHPKTSSSIRTVSYAPEIIAKIPEGEPEDFVVGLMPDSVTKEFVRLKAKCGIQCRFHDLRAYSASAMLAMGIPARYVEQSGGWAPGSAALRRIYSRVLPDKESEYNQKAIQKFKNFAVEASDKAQADTEKPDSEGKKK